MRKTLFLLLFAVFLSSPNLSWGQISLGYGAKAGVNFADVRTTVASGPGFRRGFAGGGFVFVDLGNSLFVQAEGLYMGKGFQGPLLGRPEEATLAVEYISIPLLLKLRAPLLGNANTHIYAGPSFAFKREESFDVPSTAEGISEPTVDLVQKRDVGVAMGVRFGFELGPGSVIFDVRFTPGLSEIARDSQDGDYSLDPGASNQVFSLMTGFSFY